LLLAFKSMLGAETGHPTLSIRNRPRGVLSQEIGRGNRMADSKIEKVFGN